MDAFYASIEQRDNPELKGKPVAVGGERQRGVIAAASYEARKYGIHSAMPTVTAKKKCSSLIIIRPRFHVYKQISGQIQTIFFEYTDLVEPLSLDEAFLDVTANKKHISSATDIANEIRQRIKVATGLTSSAGVSINKFLAKIASDYNKPDGFYVIRPHEAEAFVEKLEIEKFYGIGRVTAGKMHQMGIHTGKDLKHYSRDELVRLFGKTGNFFYDIARAIDDRPVDPNRTRKSLGAEFTFDRDIVSMQEILYELKNIENELISRMEKSNAKGRTLTLKVKFEDFEQITRSKSQQEIFTPDTIHSTSVELASLIHYRNKGVRLLGLALSNLDQPAETGSHQLEIGFDDII